MGLLHIKLTTGSRPYNWGHGKNQNRAAQFRRPGLGGRLALHRRLPEARLLAGRARDPHVALRYRGKPDEDRGLGISRTEPAGGRCWAPPTKPILPPSSP